MGILGIGVVDNKLNYNNVSSKQDDFELSHAAGEVVIFDNNNSLNTTNPTKFEASSREIDNVLDRVISEEKEKNASFWSKSWEFVKSFFKSKKESTPFSGRIIFCAGKMQELYQKAKNIHENVSNNLKVQGMDIQELNDYDKKKYLKIIFEHALGKLSNNGLLLKLTELHKRRTADETKNAMPKALQKFSVFLKKHFSAFFEDTAKMDIAAVKTAANNLPEEIANQLKILYVETAEERRSEVLKAALNELPKGFDEGAIIDFSITSEKMSEVQIKFSKKLIESSNLSEAEKAEKLKQLEQIQNNLRQNTLKIANYYINILKNSSYNYHKNNIKIFENRIETIDEINENFKKKVDKLSAKKVKLKEDYLQNKKKLDLTEIKMDTAKRENSKIPLRVQKDYDNLALEKKDILKRLYDVNSEVYLAHCSLERLEVWKYLTIDKIKSNLSLQELYNF